jgi:hypothetical protein
MKSKFYLFIVVLLSLTASLPAQTFEEYVREYQKGLAKLKAEQDAALTQMRQDFKKYVLERDKEFAAYLRQDWPKFKVTEGVKIQEKPKPKTLPAFKPITNPPVKKLPPLTALMPVVSPDRTLVKIPMIRIEEKPDNETNPTSFRFFGERVTVNSEPGFNTISNSGNGKQRIADYWTKASELNYYSIIEQLAGYQSRFNVNDYGYYQLVWQLASSIYIMKQQEELRILFSWFIMVRSGYDVRIAYNDRNLALLIPSYNTLYGKRYLTINHLNYYIFTPFTDDEIFTYEKNYDAANHPLDFNIRTPMKFTSKPVKKSWSFTYKGKAYPLQIQYDPGVIDFYSTYPQVDPEVYFNAAVSLITKQSLAETFTPILSAMSQNEAVNFLLAFTQKAFAYKTDPEQFGKEKFFFSEELFHYPACDCEDRSVLFSYLVRNLLELKMVALEAPDHMFTAIHFTADAFGDYLTYQGDQYIVADPTYINAPYGRTMPTVSLQDTKIIPIDDSKAEFNNLVSAREVAKKAGIRKAGSLENIVIDRSGDFFVTGYFAGTINLGSFSAKGYVDAQSYIVARLDAKGRLQWADHIPCSDNATGLAISQDSEGNLFVAGSFSGTMQEYSTNGKGDIFIARYTPTGERIWLQRARLDSLTSTSGMIYTAIFSKYGKKEQVRLAEYTADFKDYGLFVTGNSVIMNGIPDNTLVPATGPLALNNMTGVNFPELLKKEYDLSLSKQTDRAVAGLFALTGLVRQNGMELSGNEVIKALDKYNPLFRKKYPTIYRMIGAISSINNTDNIITIRTKNGTDLQVDKLRIADEARLRVSLLADGNAQIDAISGVKVGKMIVWYPLNFIRAYARTGDLLFDYDTDHSQAKINVRKDILN